MAILAGIAVALSEYSAGERPRLMGDAPVFQEADDGRQTMAARAECTALRDSSSADATPFSTSTRARRAPQMLMGS